jgi:hypothetical protein
MASTVADESADAHIMCYCRPIEAQRKIICEQTLPVLPTDVWRIICDYVLGTTLNSQSFEYYLPRDLGSSYEEVDDLPVRGLYRCDICPVCRICRKCRASELQNLIDKKCYTNFDNYAVCDGCSIDQTGKDIVIKKKLLIMRLVCKRFSQIIPRPPPKFYRVTYQVYGVSPDTLFGQNSYITRYTCTRIMFLLGVMYVFLGVKLNTTHTPVTSYTRMKLLSKEPVVTKRGIFSIEITSSHNEVKLNTPYGNYKFNYHGMFDADDPKEFQTPITTRQFMEKYYAMYRAT